MKRSLFPGNTQEIAALRSQRRVEDIVFRLVFESLGGRGDLSFPAKVLGIASSRAPRNDGSGRQFIK